MTRFETYAVWRRVAAAIVVLTLAGCASTGPPASQAAQGSQPTQAGASAAPTLTVTSTTPSASAGPPPIMAPSMALEPALATLWERAGPANERGWTWTPAVDPTGRIWAASSFDNVFWIFDRGGNYLETWGTPGSGDGQLKLNTQGIGFGAVAFRADGGFYVVDSGNYRVQQFDKNRTFVRSWGSFGTDDGQFALPIGIETDAAGNVYVYDDGPGDVQEFDPDGAFIRTAAEDVGPYMGIGPDGSVVAADHRSTLLVRFAPDGSRTLAVDIGQVASFVTDIAVASSGEIFLASSTSGGEAFEYEHLVQLDASGTLLHVWPNGGEGIGLDPAGDRLYMTFSDKTPLVRALALPGE